MTKNLNFVFNFIFIIFVLLFCSFSSYAQDSPYFSLSYDLLYDVKDDGQTYITEHGLLTNLTDTKFTNSLEINIESHHLQNISAYDELGPLVTQTIATSSTGTKILLNFNKKILGIGKNLNFTLSYQNPDIARSINNTWYINIPGAENGPYIVAYNVKLKIPSDFGEPKSIYPKPSGSDLSWTKNQITNTGIKLRFANPTPNLIPTENLKVGPDTRSDLLKLSKSIYIIIPIFTLLLLIIWFKFFKNKSK